MIREIGSPRLGPIQNEGGSPLGFILGQFSLVYGEKQSTVHIYIGYLWEPAGLNSYEVSVKLIKLTSTLHRTVFTAFDPDTGSDVTGHGKWEDEEVAWHVLGDLGRGRTVNASVFIGSADRSIKLWYDERY